MMNHSTVPRFLYQYTTIESLKCIVENKTIRFTRLDMLNDPIEGYISIETNKGNCNHKMNYAYCSCWTSMEEESVAMWYIYTNMVGARIKCRYDMFNAYGSIVLRDLNTLVLPSSQINHIPLIINGQIEYLDKVYGPVQVDYLSDEEQIHKRVAKKSLANEGSEAEFQINDIYLIEKSTCKVNHWNYEREYRFILSPLIELHGSDEAIRRNNGGLRGLPDHIDVPIYNCIDEVVLGPDVSDRKYVSITKYLNQYGIYNVRKSQIKSTLHRKHHKITINGEFEIEL